VYTCIVMIDVPHHTSVLVTVRIATRAAARTTVPPSAAHASLDKALVRPTSSSGFATQQRHRADPLDAASPARGGRRYFRKRLGSVRDRRKRWRRCRWAM